MNDERIFGREELFDADVEMLSLLPSDKRYAYFNQKLQYARSHINGGNDFTVCTALTQAQLSGQTLPELTAEDLADVYFMKGLIYRRNGKPDEALTYLQKSVEDADAFDPIKRVHADMEIAAALMMKFKREKAHNTAVTALHRFARTNPNETDAGHAYTLIAEYAEKWENTKVTVLAYEHYIKVLEDGNNIIDLLYAYLECIKALLNFENPSGLTQAHCYIEKYRTLCNANPKYDTINNFGLYNTILLNATLAELEYYPLPERLAAVLEAYTANLEQPLYRAEDMKKDVRRLYDKVRAEMVLNPHRFSDSSLIQSASEISDFEQWLKANGA